MPTSAKQTAANKKRLIKCLEEELGIVTAACKKANLIRKTFYVYYNTDSDFAEQVDAIKDIALDFVESKLFENIKANSDTAAIFYLKTKGKKRGYVERTEQINVQKDSFEDLTDEELEAKLAKAEKDAKK